MAAMMSGVTANGMAAPMNNHTAGAMMGVTNAFGNMTMGASGGMQPQQSSMSAQNEDDFGDFSTATTSLAMPTVSMNKSDPMSKLINLDGLSKNPSKMTPNTNLQQMGNPMNNAMGHPGMGQMYMPTAGVQQPGTFTIEYLDT
jgi:hypothetical protein